MINRIRRLSATLNSPIKGNKQRFKFHKTRLAYGLTILAVMAVMILIGHKFLSGNGNDDDSDAQLMKHFVSHSHNRVHDEKDIARERHNNIIQYIQERQTMTKTSQTSNDPLRFIDAKPPFPIDIVYIWDGDTKRKQCLNRTAIREHSYTSDGKHQRLKVSPKVVYFGATDKDHHEGFDLDDRYCGVEPVLSEVSSSEVFKYSLRSLHRYAKWYNRIYIIIPPETIIPRWINQQNDKIKFIRSNTIFRQHENSIDNNNREAIESNVHRISELAEHYIYLHDNFMFGKIVTWKLFFHENGKPMLLDTISRGYSNTQLNFTYYCADQAITEIQEFADQNKHWLSKKTQSDNINQNVNINIQIPDARIEHYIENMPRAFRKSDLQTFESQYPDWFLFIESNKPKYHSCRTANLYSMLAKYKGNLEHSHDIWLHVMYRRINNIDPVSILNTEISTPQAQGYGSSRSALWFKSPNFFGDKEKLKFTKTDVLELSFQDYHIFARDFSSRLQATKNYKILTSKIQAIKTFQPHTFTIQHSPFHVSDEQSEFAVKCFYEKSFRSANENDLENKMSGQTVVITGMVRNAETTVQSILTQIETLACHFGHAEIIIFENNSEDETFYWLNRWQKFKSYCLTAQSQYIKKTVLHFATDADLEKAMNVKLNLARMTREDRFVIYRNFLLNYTINARHCKPYCFDYHMSVDFDLQALNVNSIINEFRVFSELHPDGVMCTNGLTSYYSEYGGIYRDTFATLLYDHDLEGNETETIWCHRPKIPNIEKCYEVIERTRFARAKSCFGGLAIYNFSQLDESECEYRFSSTLTHEDMQSYGEHIQTHFSNGLTNLVKYFTNGNSICEHIPFHDCLTQRANTDFYIARDAVVYYGSE